VADGWAAGATSEGAKGHVFGLADRAAWGSIEMADPLRKDLTLSPGMTASWIPKLSKRHSL